MRKFIIYFFILFSLPFKTVLSGELNIFTARHYDSDFFLYEKFTEKTGIKVNVFSGKAKALEKRIEEEGKDCLGDLLIVADAGKLFSAEKKNLFQKVKSKSLEKLVSENFKTDFWFGISKRARVFFYNPDITDFKKIKNLRYEDLSNPDWKNKILIRQSSNIYNQSLVASMIENNGIEKTKIWISGLVENMARKPKGNDRSQILGVAAGEAEIAVANTYYYALMLSGQKGEEQKIAASKVKPFFPNQNDRGTHMNISGAGILKYAPNKDSALKFIDFLLTKETQKHIIKNTFEYSIIEGVEPHHLVSKMSPSFKQDLRTNVSSYGKWQSQALKLMVEGGWR